MNKALLIHMEEFGRADKNETVNPDKYKGPVNVIIN